MATSTVEATPGLIAEGYRGHSQHTSVINARSINFPLTCHQLNRVDDSYRRDSSINPTTPLTGNPEFILRQYQSILRYISEGHKESSWHSDTLYSWGLSSISEPERVVIIGQRDGLTFFPWDVFSERRAAPSVASSLVAGQKSFSHSAVTEFAAGLDGALPQGNVVEMAGRIVQAALERTMDPEITVDVDGALSFDLRLVNGWLLLAELSLDGTLDASVYDDQAGERVKRLPRATEAELFSLF